MKIILTNVFNEFSRIHVVMQKDHFSQELFEEEGFEITNVESFTMIKIECVSFILKGFYKPQSILSKDLKPFSVEDDVHLSSIPLNHSTYFLFN